jgi:hypothetical protein
MNRTTLALGFMLGLLLLASCAQSQTPLGVIGLFVFSLFVSLGFLLFGQQRFPRESGHTSGDDEHLA